MTSAAHLNALTVCQPYAELIARGVKPIENRAWPTRYRGPLAIHAGRSRDWLDEGDEQRYPGMAYGAVVAIVTLYDCLSVGKLPPDLAAHEHAHGPWCWLLRDVQRLASPVPFRGAQGLWLLPVSALPSSVTFAPERPSQPAPASAPSTTPEETRTP
jgi:hypothetical protein